MNQDELLARIEELESENEQLSVRAKHLANELSVTREEYESTLDRYFTICGDMEQKVVERSSEVQELQVRISRAERMEALGLLAGGVAHDGNNILAGIIGYLELLQMELEPGDPREELVLEALAASNQMESLITDLLTLTQRSMTPKKIININEVIRFFVQSPELIKMRTSRYGLHVNTNLEPDLLNVKGASSHIYKALANLLAVLVELMDGPGDITISTSNAYVDQPVSAYDLKIDEGDYIVLSIRYTGNTVEEKHLQRLFEPFYTKKVMGIKGSGLGMALLYGIVKDHDGFIKAEMGSDGGGEFSIYLPICRDIETYSDGNLHGDEIKGSGETILVVDDIRTQREILTGILSRLGYSVSAVASGEDAIEHLRREKVDLLILDMIMDGMDGLDTFIEARKINSAQRAIIASGYSEGDRVVQALNLGVLHYVKKPYTVIKMGTIVKRALKVTV